MSQSSSSPSSRLDNPRLLRSNSINSANRRQPETLTLSMALKRKGKKRINRQESTTNSLEQLDKSSDSGIDLSCSRIETTTTSFKMPPSKTVSSPLITSTPINPRLLRTKENAVNISPIASIDDRTTESSSPDAFVGTPANTKSQKRRRSFVQDQNTPERPQTRSASKRSQTRTKKTLSPSEGDDYALSDDESPVRKRSTPARTPGRKNQSGSFVFKSDLTSSFDTTKERNEFVFGRLKISDYVPPYLRGKIYVEKLNNDKQAVDIERRSVEVEEDHQLFKDMSPRAKKKRKMKNSRLVTDDLEMLSNIDPDFEDCDATEEDNYAGKALSYSELFPNEINGAKRKSDPAKFNSKLDKTKIQKTFSAGRQSVKRNNVTPKAPVTKKAANPTIPGGANERENTESSSDDAPENYYPEYSKLTRALAKAKDRIWNKSVQKTNEFKPASKSFIGADAYLTKWTKEFEEIDKFELTVESEDEFTRESAE